MGVYLRKVYKMNKVLQFFSDKTDDVPKNYFRRHKTVLKISGISLDETSSGKIYKMYSLILLIIVSSYSCLAILDIFKDSYEDVIQIMPYYVGFMMATAKMIVLRINRKRVANILNRMEQKPFIANYARCGKLESKFIKQFFIIHVLQTSVYWSSVLLTFTFNLFYSLEKRIYNDNPESWFLPYGKFILFNTSYTPAYELSLIFQSIAAIVWFMNYTTSDLILTGVLCNATFQFKNLQSFLKSITCKTSKSFSSFTQFLEHHTKEAVKYHLAIIELIQELENLFNETILYVFLNNFVMMGAVFYHATTLPFGDPRVFKCAQDCSAIIIQLLILNFWGEQIVGESVAVGDAAYQTRFVGVGINFQKNLQLIILRSQTPAKLTAGKINNLCLATFMWICRTSYSVFMVLRSGRL